MALQKLSPQRLDTTTGIILTPANTPSGPIAGQIYYDSTNNQVQFYNGSDWGSMGGVEGIVDNSNATAITIGADESVTLTGDLIVTGTTTTINSTSLLVEDRNIELGKVTTPTDGTADGGGIILKGATDKTILWTNSTDTWDFNQGISTSGAITWASGGSANANTAYTHSQVAGGDSVHVSTTENTNWDTAYGWGDHSSAGYATLNSQWTTTGNDIYYNTGNVGIGTTAPDVMLQLGERTSSGTSTPTIRMEHKTGSDNASWTFGCGSASDGGTNDNFYLKADGGTRMVVANGGNVGIGTTAPDGKVHIWNGSAGSVSAH